MIVETAEYVSDRTDAPVVERGRRASKTLETLGAVARQVRTLASNTSLEASRLGGNATVAEIARQMRLLSQQVTALSDHLSTSLYAQDVALGELSGAIDAILADAASAQAILERRLAGERRAVRRTTAWRPATECSRAHHRTGEPRAMANSDDLDLRKLFGLSPEEAQGLGLESFGSPPATADDAGDGCRRATSPSTQPRSRPRGSGSAQPTSFWPTSCPPGTARRDEMHGCPIGRMAQDRTYNGHGALHGLSLAGSVAPWPQPPAPA